MPVGFSVQPGDPMLRYIALLVSLTILWCLLSGYWQPLLLTLGATSVGFVMLLSHQMNIVDDDSLPIRMLGKMLLFWVKLLVKIVKSNLAVAWQIIGGNNKAHPTVVKLPLPQSWGEHHDLDKVMYANAVTLTPGTASLDIAANDLVVHCLQKDSADELLQGDILDILPNSGVRRD